MVIPTGYEDALIYQGTERATGKVIEVDNSMRTKVPFIYACGDIIKKDVYQIVTAASDGCIAALSLKKDINKSEK